MSATAELLGRIEYSYDKTGQIQCRNPKGLTFFLNAEPPRPQTESRRPAAASRSMPEPALVSRPAAPATEAPELRKSTEKGWLGKFFG